MNPQLGHLRYKKSALWPKAARALRRLRYEIMRDNSWLLRELYKSLETLGETACAPPPYGVPKA